MLGYVTRVTAVEEGNTVRHWRLDYRYARRIRREARARAARCADAAHRCGVRRSASVFVRVMMVAVGVLMHMIFSNCGAPMVRFAQRRQHAGIAAQRQGREQQAEQNDAAGAPHGENLSTGIVD